MRSYCELNSMISPKSHLSGFLSSFKGINFQSAVPSRMSCTELLFVTDPMVMIISVVPSRDSPPLCSMVILLVVSPSEIDPMRLTEGADGAKENEKTMKFRKPNNAMVIPSNKATERTSDTAYFERLFFVIVFPFVLFRMSI